MKITFDDLCRIREQLADIIAKLNPYQTIMIDSKRIRVLIDALGMPSEEKHEVTL